MLVFVFSKSITFLSPLFLSNHINTTQYALIEYGISIGSLIAAVLSLGQTTAYPYFRIKKNKPNISSLINIHSYIIIILGIFIWLVWFYNFETSEYWGLIFGLLYTLQRLISSKFQTIGKVSIAVLTDSFFYIFLIIILFFPATRFQVSSVISLSLCCIALSVFNIYIATEINLFKSIKWFKKTWRNLYSYGFSVLFGSVSLLAFLAFPRLLIEQLISLEAVGIFSFYYRLSAVSVAIRMSLNIFFFKKIFEYKSEKLDMPFSIFLIFIFPVTLLFYYLIPYFFSSRLVLLNSINEYNQLYLNLTGFSIFWNLFSIQETIIYKEKLTKSFSIGVILIILFMLLATYLLSLFNQFNLNTFSLLFLISGFLIWLLQFFILKKAKILFKKTLFISILILAFFVILNYFV